MGDFNTRLYSNQIEGRQSHIGPATFSTEIGDDLLQATNLSYMIDFLQDNELSIVSSMRPRQPSQLITSLEISKSPPPIHFPTIDTRAALDHIICRIEHQTYFGSMKSLPSVPLPGLHRHFLLSTKLIAVAIFHQPSTPSSSSKEGFYLHWQQTRVSSSRSQSL